MAMAPPTTKPFVMIHYSNPTEDSRRIENRQTVAKYAMLGRQKNGTQNSNRQSSDQQKSKQRRPPPGTAPTAKGSSSSRRALSDESQWSQSSVGDDTQETSPDFGSSPQSLPSLTETASTTTYSSTASQYSASQYDGSPPLPEDTTPLFWDPNINDATAQQFPSIPLPYRTLDPGFDILPSQNPISEFPEFPIADLRAFNGDFGQLPAEGDSRQDPNNIRRGDDTRLAQRRRQGKERHKQAKLSRECSTNSVDDDSFVDDELDLSGVVSFPVTNGITKYNSRISPRTLLSGSVSDPFSCLPIKANAHTHELLYQYMNARLISNMLVSGSPETFERIKKMRHTVWGPLTMKSKAALNALVAYVESTPGLPIRSRSKDFLFSHVQAALEAIREALSKPSVATDDSICLAVVLLMLTAQREGSVETYASHAAGLSTLLHHRTQAIRRHGEVEDTVSRLRTFYISNPADECIYCKTNGSPRRSTSPKATSPENQNATDPKDFTDQCFPRGNGFRDLISRGFLSESMTAFVEPAMIWSTLAERARKDKLSAAIGATHAWIDEGEFSLGKFAQPLDVAVHTSVRLCFYLSSWLDWQHSCIAVRRMAESVAAFMRRTELDYLLLQCAPVICWICLTAGSVCEGPSRTFFSNLLARAQNVLGLELSDFQATVDSYGQIFVWSSTMTPVAQNFWDEAYFETMGMGGVCKPDAEQSVDYAPLQGFGGYEMEMPMYQMDGPAPVEGVGRITDTW